MIDEDKRIWVKKVLNLNLPEFSIALTPADCARTLVGISKDAAALGIREQIESLLKATAAAIRSEGAGAEIDLQLLQSRVAELAGAAEEKAGAAEVDAAQAAGAAEAARLADMRAALAGASATIAQAPATLSEACGAYASLLRQQKTEAGIASGDDDDVVALAEAAGDNVPPFDAVEAALAAIINELEDAADEAAQQALLAEAAAEIADYRSLLAAPILTEMEETDAGSYRIRSAIEESLDDLLEALHA